MSHSGIDPRDFIATFTPTPEQLADIESFPMNDEERERQAESETEPTGCYRALAWIRKSMGAAA